MDRSPSIWRIFTRDTVAAAAGGFVIASLWCLAWAVIGDASGASNAQAAANVERRTPQQLVCTGFTLAVGLPVFFWRVHKVRAFFGRAIPSTAVIKRIRVGPRGGRVDFEYTYAGESFAGHALVGPDTYINLLQKGDEVRILLDPEDPMWVVIRGLWEEGGER